MRSNNDSSTSLIALSTEHPTSADTDRSADEPTTDTQSAANTSANLSTTDTSPPADTPNSPNDNTDNTEHPEHADSPDDFSDLSDLSDLDLESLYKDLSPEDRREFVERMLETLDSVIDDSSLLASPGSPELADQMQELISVRAQLRQALQAEDQLRALQSLIEGLQDDPVQILKSKSLLAPWFEALSELTLPRVQRLAHDAAALFRDLGPPDSETQASLDAIGQPAGRALFCALNIGQHRAPNASEARRFMLLRDRLFIPLRTASWMRPANNLSFTDEDMDLLERLPASPIHPRDLLAAWLRLRLRLN